MNAYEMGNMAAHGQMVIEWDVPIEMEDGVVLRADVFRPAGDGVRPVIMSMGPYAKGLAFQDGFTFNWTRMIESHPEVARGTSNRYQNWEVVDPEKWVPEGYVCIRVDSRGAGRSPGYLDVWSVQEATDYYQCIEWAASRMWSNGRIGLLGISYYAMNQWHVAALRPPHLAAICVWEGAADYYRDVARHGGILSEFLASWHERQVVRVQHGVGDLGATSRVTEDLVSGPETLDASQLRANRTDPNDQVLRRELDGDFYRERSPNFESITVPLLSSGNWGGHGLHLRGNTEGFQSAASTEKWLEVHGDTHFSPFYSDRGVALQKAFFDHFLYGVDNGWDDRQPVELQVRQPGEVFTTRFENEWPLARTQWTKFYLNSAELSLGSAWQAGPDISYQSAGDGVTFMSAPMAEEMEVTGPVAMELLLSSDSEDADVFVALRVFDTQGQEVLFTGTNDPQVPVALGWLRASHRKIDPERSKPHRPFHSHDEKWRLVPGEPVVLQIEIWPTCIVVPVGYRIGVTVRGRDYENDCEQPEGSMYPMRGTGPFVHNNTLDRPSAIFGGKNTLHFPQGVQSFLLLPVIPER